MEGGNRMNKETYEALKRIIEQAEYIAEATTSGIKESDLDKIEAWIDEVAKEYEDEDHPDPERLQSQIDDHRDSLREDGINV